MVLASNQQSDNVEDYENGLIDFLLVGSSVVVFLVSMYMMITGIYEKWTTAKHKMGKRTKMIFYILMCGCLCFCCRKKKKIEVDDPTKVKPMTEKEKKKLEDARKMEELRQIRIKYGASSIEYQKALAAFHGADSKLDLIDEQEKKRKLQDEQQQIAAAKLLAEKEKKAMQQKKLKAEEEEMRFKKQERKKRQQQRLLQKEKEEKDRKAKEEENARVIEEEMKAKKDKAARRREQERIEKEARDKSLADEEERLKAEFVDKEKLDAETEAKRRLAQSNDFITNLQVISDRTDDLDQYAKLQTALKVVEKAIKNGLEPTPELNRKMIEMRILEKRLKHVGELRKLVLKLNSKTLAEVRSFKTPHPFVMMAMQATFFLLGSNLDEIDTWGEVRTKMGKTGKESLKRKIGQFHFTQVTKAHLAAAKKKIREIDGDKIEKISQGAYVLYGWATSIIMQLDKNFYTKHHASKFQAIKNALKVDHALLTRKSTRK